MNEKLSDIIIEMIEPYHSGEKDEIELLMLFAQCAWNVDLLPEAHKEKAIRDVLNVFEEVDQEDMLELIDLFKLYKKSNHADDERFILDYQVVAAGENPVIKVRSQPVSELKKAKNPNMNKTKVGRNEPCPCGSGKKYKKCCG
ncbi:SECA protein [Haloplasma contractile SSD-17B]|uniref:SECA protein n=1 Tax=Haloplasma contractile SSD-17B TaxID=1033810 RepID=F7Q1U8_9MOLU|nr:SEC-C metal-binding domain-containing protein [Haloplasma contractile]ERJ12241.1 SECA protein [Haloplasma contractile SSD-17B]